MTPKLRVVLEKLAREHPATVLKLLLAFEKAGEEADWRYCCQIHPGSETGHGANCPLDRLLKDIGLPSPEAREAMLLQMTPPVLAPCNCGAIMHMTGGYHRTDCPNYKTHKRWVEAQG